MTRHCDNKAIDQVLEVLIENGLDGMATAFEIIFNEAIKLNDQRFWTLVLMSAPQSDGATVTALSRKRLIAESAN